MHFPVQPALFPFHQQGMNRNLRNIRTGSSLRCVFPRLGPRVLEPMDSTSLCSDLSMMFLDSPYKTLSLVALNPALRTTFWLWLSQHCLPGQVVLYGSKVPNSPDIVSSPDEQFKLGLYSSLASVNCTLLVKLDFDLTLTSSVAWTWFDVPRSVNEVLNKTSFAIELTSWFTIDRQSHLPLHRSLSDGQPLDGLHPLTIMSVNLSILQVTELSHDVRRHVHCPV